MIRRMIEESFWRSQVSLCLGKYGSLAVSHWVPLTLASVPSGQKDQGPVVLPKPTFHKKSGVGRRVVLPMIIQGTTIISRPDSGSEDSIIAADLVSRLRVDIDSSPESQKEFRVANGKFVRALGRVVLEVAFAKEPSTQLFCTFYIFTHLIIPMIMGMSFLDSTETLVKYKHRLQAYTPPTAGPLQLCSLNSPRCRLYCQANSEPNLANADTGSEVELMSLAYVQKRGFNMTAVDTRSSAVQFADGSTSDLAGKVTIQIVLGTRDGPRLSITFYILKGLTCDILFGEDFLYETDAFETYRNAFSITDDYEACDVNTIVWFNMAEWSLSRLWKGRKRREEESGKSTNFVIFQRPDAILTTDCC